MRKKVRKKMKTLKKEKAKKMVKILLVMNLWKMILTLK
jgi:hypothetical protein